MERPPEGPQTALGKLVLLYELFIIMAFGAGHGHLCGVDGRTLVTRRENSVLPVAIGANRNVSNALLECPTVNSFQVVPQHTRVATSASIGDFVP